ncbi:MAG: hypothetical protein WCK08_16780 [Betaproteobacteria bacterium]
MNLNAMDPRSRAGRRQPLLRAAAAVLLLALAACTTAPPSTPVAMPAPSAAPVPAPVPVQAPTPAPAAGPVTAPPAVVIAEPAAPAVIAVQPPQVQDLPVQIAAATSARDYRAYGAKHLYERHRDRIFKGKLPPLLYAVGVLNVAIDSRGAVRKIEWMREPKHAPEVVAEIERMVRAAAPFPAPVRMGAVIYTDVWLWDKSGRFQLDTLTEGQLSALPAPVASPGSPLKSVAERSRTPAKKATSP